MTLRVGWLHDDVGYMGGAELTMTEFMAAAPDGVQVIGCAPGRVDPALDRYVVGNCHSYSAGDLEPFCDCRVIRYHHDVSRAEADRALVDATHIYCSPLQAKYMNASDASHLIPPAIDLAKFRAVANQNHRAGACCIGRMSYGKGVQQLSEYAEPVDVYSSVAVPSAGSLQYRGAATDVAAILAQYERFVFLPTAIEPFGRAVVEAWAAGLKLIVNGNVGCVHWIEQVPEKLESAARDFWRVVSGGSD